MQNTSFLWYDMFAIATRVLLMLVTFSEKNERFFVLSPFQDKLISDGLLILTLNSSVKFSPIVRSIVIGFNVTLIPKADKIHM